MAHHPTRRPAGTSGAAEIRSYAERLFDYRIIGTLAETDARESFTIPAERVGATYTGEALEQMVRIPGRYPYFIMEFGSATWEVAQSTPFTAEAIQPATITGL